MLPEPDYSGGVALMLRVPEDAVAQGGFPPETSPAPHLTLAYFGDVDETDALTTRDEFLAYGRRVAAETMPFELTLNGITRFSGDEDGDPLVVNADAPEVEDARRRAMDEAPIPVRRTHGFSPHVTIAYLSPDESNPIDRWDTVTAPITELIVAWGEDESVVRLGDAQVEEQMMNVITAAADAASGSAAEFPDGKSAPLPDDTLALTVDENGRVLELIFSDTSGVYYRDNGTWVKVPDNEDPPTIVDREWVDVPADAVAVYDKKRAADDDISKNDFALGDAA